MQLPKVNYYAALTAPGTWGGVAGIVAQNVAEKLLYSNLRNIYGVAKSAPGQNVKFYPPKTDGTADTSKPDDSMFGLRLQATRVAVAVAGIALSATAKSELVKGIGAGVTAVSLANLVQDQFPALR